MTALIIIAALILLVAVTGSVGALWLLYDIRAGLTHNPEFRMYMKMKLAEAEQRKADADIPFYS